MCINPMKIADVGFVACRQCWQCRETKIDDWVGRCVAETKSATAAHVVTLTYGRDESTDSPDHIKATVLTYSDIQKYLYHLRADGFPVRYFVVGEYGSKKGRAHWHIILFWQADWPDHEIRKNFMQKHWKHGWSFWDVATASSVRYACKYLLKDPQDDSLQGWGPMMSKYPPLGHDYFRWLADQFVKQGLSPQSLIYTFPDVVRVPGGWRTKTAKSFREAAKPVRYHMTGKTAENFLSYFVDRWREVYNDEPPRSEPVWAFLNKGLEGYFDRHAKPVFQFKVKGPVPKSPPIEGGRVQFCDKANCYYCDANGVRLWYSLDIDGDPAWQEKVRATVDNRHGLIQSGVTLPETNKYLEATRLMSSPSSGRRKSKPGLSPGSARGQKRLLLKE